MKERIVERHHAESAAEVSVTAEPRALDNETVPSASW